MKRVIPIVVLAMSLLMLVPAASVSADECPSVEGHALLKWGMTPQTGTAHLVYDGGHINVDFVEVPSAVPGTIRFFWDFPEGTVEIIETFTLTPLNGPLVFFDSTLEVVDGGSGTWTWSGVSNSAAGVSHIQTLEGSICFDS